VNPTDVEAALRPHTKLVSVMLANNETGAIQPVGKIARIAKAHGALVHTDAVQAAAKLPLDLSGEFKNVDLLSISGHKIYGPQGTGALFVRQGVQLAPLFHGGPHERQRRAGTENVPGIVGLGRAAEIALAWLEGQDHQLLASKVPPTPIPGSQTPAELAARRNHFERRLLALIPGASINAADAPRISNTTHLRIDGIDAETLVITLDLQEISTSFGSACMSGAAEPSHVLVAMGLTPEQARSSLRLSLSRLTTDEEIAEALEIIPAAVAQLRSVT
jgi:cysteine desulfurase